MSDEREVRNGETGAGRSEQPIEETVGEVLLAARERSGMSLEQIGQETKIPVPTLRHLETDSFEAIPARVYVKGFLRAYALVLGLDPQQLLNKYEVQTGQTHHSRGDLWEIEEQTVEEKLPAVRVVSRFVIPVLLFAILILILVRVFGGRSARSPADTADTLFAVPAVQAGAPAPNNAAAPASGETESPRGGEPGGEEAEGRIRREDAAAQPAEPAWMQLRIIAHGSETTWFDLVVVNRRSSGSDSLAHDFILYPGQTQTFRSNDSFFFRTIGNAGGFSLELDGKPLPPLGERGRVRKNVRVTKTGVAGI